MEDVEEFVAGILAGVVVSLTANLRAQNRCIRFMCISISAFSLEGCFNDTFLHLLAQLDGPHCKLSTVISMPFQNTFASEH